MSESITTTDGIPADFVKYTFPILRVLHVTKSIFDVWNMLSLKERRMYEVLRSPIHPLLKIKPAQPMTPYGIFVIIQREKLIGKYPNSTPYDVSVVLQEMYKSLSDSEMEEYISLAKKGIEVYRIAHGGWMNIVKNTLEGYHSETGISLADSDWKLVPIEFVEKYLKDNREYTP